MKANLPQNEPRMLARWEELRIYHRIRQARAGSPVYLLHDGPPYANGAIHMGTALNKTIKDFVVKSKAMAGFDAPYVPGFDCHGLPIEKKVDEQLGRKKLEMPAHAVRAACRKFAEKYLDLQRSQFKRIGVFGRWEQPYLTMDPAYEVHVAETFYSFLEKGVVYKGLRPVYWCIFDKTALAEAEVEYADHTSHSIYVKYRLLDDAAKVDAALAGKTVWTIIWTTTPWTLPASMAVAFHPEEEYVAADSGGEVYIVAARLLDEVVKQCGLVSPQVIARFPGRVMDRTLFAHPFLEREVLGVLADYVTMDQGTGAVHTAPSHGADDFYTGQKYGLETRGNLDDSGRFIEGLPEYQGKTVFEANPQIVELLAKRGVLMASGKITHSYPHCWRCHNPVIFRATEQWFIGMDNPMGTSTLRQRGLEEIRKVRWDPAWGEERIGNMIATRPDWCISRQRVWGIPVPVLFCDDCGEVQRSPEIRRAVLDFIAREGTDGWYKAADASEIAAPGIKCPNCGGTRFRRENDIIDVWFESGSSQAAVLGREGGLSFPADLYLEGGDQHRGWFQSSLLCSIGLRNAAPYRQAVTNGWVLDAQGRPMSKSLGNVVDPNDVAARMGGEIVRLWSSSVDFREDMRCSDELLERVGENYRKIRNTFRFILGNLHDFTPSRDVVAFADMEPFDQYMLLRTAEMNERVRQWYEEFTFHRIYHQLVDFCVVELSALYFDVLKDRLYTFAPNQRARRSAQTAVWRIGEALVRLLAPIMSFTSDEIWQHLPKLDARPESVHLALFPEVEEITGSVVDEGTRAGVKADWETLLAVREEAMRALEEARKNKLIGPGLEAQVTIAAGEPVYDVVSRYARYLPALLLVSQVAVERDGGNGAAPVKVSVARAAGEKCERCWNYSTHVGENAAYPTVCERCSAALAEIEGKS